MQGPWVNSAQYIKVGQFSLLLELQVPSAPCLPRFFLDTASARGHSCVPVLVIWCYKGIHCLKCLSWVPRTCGD